MDPLTARFQAKPEVVFTRLDESQAALLHLETKRYYSLNETASRLWELLAEPQDLATLCEVLQKEFDTSVNELQASVRRFLEELWSEDLVTVLTE